MAKRSSGRSSGVLHDETGDVHAVVRHDDLIGREYDAAEANLSEAQAILSEAKGAAERDRTDVLNDLVELYDAWHAAEPGKSYDAKAAEWKDRLQEQESKP